MDLFTAAESGNVEEVKRLMNQGSDIDAICPNRHLSPLQIATVSGHTEVMRLLMEKGANINVKTREGASLLHLAAQRQDQHCCDFLLARGANPNLASDDGITPLHTAVVYGGVENLRLLLSKGADPNAKRSDGNTGLHLAIEHDRKAELEMLLDNGADVNAQNGQKFTPLHCAAIKRNSVISQTLIMSYNADPNIVDHEGLSCLHRAARSGSSDTVKFILSSPRCEPIDIDARCDGMTAVHYAILNGHQSIVKTLLQYGAEYNTVSRNPVHECDAITMAKTLNHRGIIELLELVDKLIWAAIENDSIAVINYIDMGAVINARDSKDGKSALHHVVINGNYHLCVDLLSKGARVDLITFDGRTPLHLAFESEQFYIAEKLIRHAVAKLSPIDLNRFLDAKNYGEEDTALHMVAKIPRMDFARLLIKSGAVYNARNAAGRTPAEVAEGELKAYLTSISLMFNHTVDGNSLQVLETVAEHPTIVNARDLTGGETALFWALSRNHRDIAHTLLDAGTKVWLVSNRGTTVLHRASTSGYADIIDDMVKQCSAHEKRPFVNFKTYVGKNSALHVAKNVDVARRLLQHGARFNDKNNKGQTPIDSVDDPEVKALLELTGRMYRMVKYGPIDDQAKAQINPHDWLAIEGCTKYFSCVEAKTMRGDPLRDLCRSDLEHVLEWVMHADTNAARHEFADCVEAGNDFRRRFALVGIEI